MNDKKCLVLGGAGFIGSHVVDVLVNDGNEVTVFDRPNVSMNNLHQCIKDITIIHGDLNNPIDIESAVRETEVVYHFAATTLPSSSNQNPIYDVESNLISAIRLIEIALKNNVKKIIFASSGGTVYGLPKHLPITEEHPTEPICSYGITKLCIEKYLSLFYYLHGLPYTVLRIANPYGSRQSLENMQGVIPIFLNSLKNGSLIEIWGDGAVSRDYLHISDLVSATLKAGKSEVSNTVLNIGSGNAYSLIDILLIMERVTSIKPKIKYLPARKLDVPINYLDIRKAERMLNWRPNISLEDGIKKTWDWINSCQ
jgi:UDP-glucose 4-epimerase